MLKTLLPDEVKSRCDCIEGSTVNGVREPIFTLDEPPGHKI